MSQKHFADRGRALARVDLAPDHRQPSTARIVLATAASIVGSLLADALLVKIGSSLFPSTKGFGHFRLSDYGTLTTIGVIAAGAAWPMVTRITSSPEWLFVRLAALVTLVLWLPDGWLLVKGEPAKAVVILMLMHLAIAVVTYNLLVHCAPVGRAAPDDGGLQMSPLAALAARETGTDSDTEPSPAPETGSGSSSVVAPAAGNRLWIAMSAATGLEFLLGMGGLVVVPLDRPSGWLPSRGEPLYIAHAVVGAVLAVGGLLLLGRAARAGRLVRLGALIGAAGLGLGVVGGVLASYHAGRLAGMGLMLVGAMVAGLGYLVPVIA
jgi:hypothetical protein